MTKGPVNRSEQFVFDICRKSFLSLWTYNNPRSPVPGKELIDILVVFDPDVLLISVKDIEFKDKGDLSVAYKRWEKRAISDSYRQLKRAVGWLRKMDRVIAQDGSPGLSLPPVERRKVHLIAVALGNSSTAFLKSGDEGFGYVHVMGEQSFRDILGELDTMTEFIGYFSAKAAAKASGVTFMILGSESNLLGWYLSRNRTLPTGDVNVLIDESVWPGLQEQPEFKRRKEADRVSYAFDELIETLTDGIEGWKSPEGLPVLESEKLFRVMASETRFARRNLAEMFTEFFLSAKSGKTISRLCKSISGVVYVLRYFKDSEHTTKEYRAYEMQARCFIARHILGEGSVVFIGISFGDRHAENGFCQDLVYLEWPNWNNEDDAAARQLQESTGLYKGCQIQHRHDDEFPLS